MNQNTEQEQSEKKEDRRVRRTRKLLTQALTQLLREKQLKDITVKELTALADVNRGTFYLYYKDIFDMLETIEDNLFADFDRIITSHESDLVTKELSRVFQDLFTCVMENKEICSVLLSPNGDMNFLHRLNEILRGQIYQLFSRESPGLLADGFDYTYSFVTFGCAGLFRAWLAGGCKETPAQMAATADRMIRSGTLPM